MASNKQIIGRVETVKFTKLGDIGIAARIDTGAKTSSLWASKVKIRDDGRLSFKLFAKGSPYYSGKDIVMRAYEETVVSSSMGGIQQRYKVKLTVVINNRKIRAAFTLADRSRQVYPVLIGRNILRGKYIVDVMRGKALTKAEQAKTKELRKLLKVKKGKKA